MIKVDVEGANAFLDRDILLPDEVRNAADKLPGLPGTGWISLPEDYGPELSVRLKDAADKISEESDVFVVAGIGGSYLGARSAIEFIKSPFYNALPKNEPDILFVGCNLSDEYLTQIFELIGDRDFSVNVVSKSGSTLETAVALRFFKELLISRYGSGGVKNRLYVTTEKTGPLRDTARYDGCMCFELPEGVGGRYSVLTAVGLLPCAVAGINIDAVMTGAREELETGLDAACLYASVRQALYRGGKKIEILACFDPAFRSMGEWWKQLFGESEGKEGLGIFPAYADYTADLHSLGQYVQEGERTVMETFVTFTEPRVKELIIPCGTIHRDRINALSGLGLFDLNRAASMSVKNAHIDGGVPVVELILPSRSAESFGALTYFFERACAVSALISGVDPFGQPGVEAYKNKLYNMLGL